MTFVESTSAQDWALTPEQLPEIFRSISGLPDPSEELMSALEYETDTEAVRQRYHEYTSRTTVLDDTCLAAKEYVTEFTDAFSRLEDRSQRTSVLSAGFDFFGVREEYNQLAWQLFKDEFSLNDTVITEVPSVQYTNQLGNVVMYGLVVVRRGQIFQAKYVAGHRHRTEFIEAF